VAPALDREEAFADGGAAARGALAPAPVSAIPCCSSAWPRT
jgi:hypothetical protein